MPNTFFQFKQFRIDQDKSGMKVTTEGCILGAWVDPKNHQRILDIGTGTGLLGLMIAQNSTAKIDAVELDIDAANQAAINFKNSPWKNQLSVHQSAIQDFKPEYNYDLIVSNPPFFSNHLKTTDPKKRQALHDDTLSQTDLLNSISKLLSIEGIAYVLLPEYESELLQSRLEEFKLYPTERLKIYNQPAGKTFRVILTIKKEKQKLSECELVIRNGAEYTSEFKELLKDYYLAF